MKEETSKNKKTRTCDKIANGSNLNKTQKNTEINN